MAKKFVYVFKDEFKSRLIQLRNKIDHELEMNEESFLFDDCLSLIPSFYRVFSYLWMKSFSDLFKKKYL